MTPAERMRLQQGVAIVCAKGGAPAMAELLEALTARVGGGAALAELLDGYQHVTRSPARRPRPAPVTAMRGAR